MGEWHGDNPKKSFPKGLTDSEVDQSVALTTELGNRLAKNPPKKVGGGKFNYRISNTLVHPGNPIQIDVRDSKDVRVATIGFYMLVQANQQKLVLVNIQGSRGKREELEALSKQVGENWRIWAVKRIKQLARVRKVRVVGQLPPLYFLIGAEASPQAYKRYLRQYKQTFRKAGVDEILKHHVSKYPEEERKFWNKFKKEEKKEEWKRRHNIK